jgi:hypothetical protein
MAEEIACHYSRIARLIFNEFKCFVGRGASMSTDSIISKKTISNQPLIDVTIAEKGVNVEAIVDLIDNRPNYSGNPFDILKNIGETLSPGNLKDVFPLVVSLQLLGWNDVLHCASPSARSELRHSLFKIPFLVAGNSTIDAFIEWKEVNPSEIEEGVRRGIDLAIRILSALNYDRKWPMQFGLEPLLSSQYLYCPNPNQSSEIWTKSCELLIQYYCTKSNLTPMEN